MNLRLHALLSLPALGGFAQTSNPIPARIGSESVTVEVSDWLQAPATAGTGARARLSTFQPARDGTSRLFVNDQRGQLYVVASPTDPTLSLYLNLRALTAPGFRDSPGLGTGFTGFTFHPTFATNGKFYTAHMEAPGSGPADFGPAATGPVVLQGVVLEWTATNPAAPSFAGSKRELMRIDYTHQFHGLQEIGFNPYARPEDEDYGLLYIAAGDGNAVAQNRSDWSHSLRSPYGSLLRIDPLGFNSGNGRYGVPASNPFAADGDPATLGEIYASGFRNPHRFSWDSLAPHRLYLGDIGEKLIEEVNLVVKGGDYGYSAREGTFELRLSNTAVAYPLPANDAANNYVYPIAQYDHDEGRAIAGGYVYRGNRIPALRGCYVFGDIVNGRLFYIRTEAVALGQQATVFELGLTRDGASTTLRTLAGTPTRADLRFGIDGEGELYVMTKGDGRIRRLGPAAGEVPVPPAAGRLVNIATRGRVEGEAGLMIGGFVVQGGARRVLIRGVGPTLGGFGVAGTLVDPVITLFQEQTAVATNDNWGQAANAADIRATATAVGAFALAEGGADAALLLELPAGAYTVHLSGKAGSSGVALIEVYEVR